MLKLQIKKKIKILAIETSCDETAISIVEATGGRPAGRPGFKAPRFKILAQAISSQVALHAVWGGVVPNLAKREHEKNFTPLLDSVLTESKLKILNSKFKNQKSGAEKEKVIKKYLARENDLAKLLIPFLQKIKAPKIDAIAVTEGPGLEPALWVGINATRALAAAWDLPIIPTNHMEGHIVSSLVDTNLKFKSQNLKTKIKTKARKIIFPAIALLISGGHTELVLIKDYLKYKVIGATRDDAVGEAFDKVARILGLPYPGGPEISKLADLEAKLPLGSFASKLPRPMLNSPDFDFSFSGLKTAVLYLVKRLSAQGELGDTARSAIAREFQDAVIEVLMKKTLAAARKFKVKSIIIGGGVIANTALRKAFTKALHPAPRGSTFPNLKVKPFPAGINLLIPDLSLTGDNATMIAAAAYFRYLNGKRLLTHKQKITARGNLSLN